MDPDALGRAPIAEAMRTRVSLALAAIPEGKRGALLVVSDEGGTRGQVAAKVGNGWQVAAGAGWQYHESRPYGYVAVEGQW